MSALQLVHLPVAGLIAANAGAWLVCHTATGYLVHRLPVERLGRDGPVLRLRRWERGGWAYRRIGITWWKDRLPEAGALFGGGVSKRRLPSRTAVGLDRFAVETRRAERGHWLAMACGPLAVLWNPPAGALAMIAYGVVVNAPFILIQRYNRARVVRVLERSSGSVVRSPSSTRRTSGSSMP